MISGLIVFVDQRCERALSMHYLLQSLRVFAADIKFSHTLFALPFVGTGLIVGKVPLPSLSQTFLVLICMVAARSFAMGMNRYLDAEIDAGNLRTQVRAVPSGKLSKKACLGWSVFFALVFIGGASTLSSLAGLLSIPLLVILASYSVMKRMTWLTHWYLGLCLGLAPIAAEIALKGEVTFPVVLVGVSVAFWTAGFDLLYSLQDRQYDKTHDLKSIPASFGPRAALASSICSFVAMIICLVGAGYETGAGIGFYSGIVVISGVLGVEHWLVRDAWRDGTSKNINAAFFTSNAFVSIIIFIFTLMDEIYRVS